MTSRDRTLSLLAALCAVAACGSGASAPTAAPASCSTQELQLWLEDVLVDGVDVRVLHPAGVQLVELTATTAPPLQLTLIIGRDSVFFGGERLADPDALTDADITAIRERLALDRTAKHLALPVIADARAPAGSVVRVLNAARAVGRSRIALVGERAFRAREPRPSSFTPKLRRVSGFDQSLHTQRMRKYRWAAQIYRDCPTALGLFRNQAMALTKQLTSLPRALEDCDCKADLAAIEAHVWGLSGRIGLAGRLVAHDLELAADDDHSATVVQLGVSEPWSSGFQRIAKLPGRLRLRVLEPR